VAGPLRWALGGKGEHQINARWTIVAAVVCLAGGVVAPYAGLAGLLARAFGGAPKPYLYVLSWCGLGLVGMLATNGFALHSARRNRASIRAICVCLSLFALSWLPVFAAIDSMGRAVAAPRAAAPAERPPNHDGLESAKPDLQSRFRKPGRGGNAD
jgi:hypothetical protein